MGYCLSGFGGLLASPCTGTASAAAAGPDAPPRCQLTRRVPGSAPTTRLGRDALSVAATHPTMPGRVWALRGAQPRPGVRRSEERRGTGPGAVRTPCHRLSSPAACPGHGVQAWRPGQGSSQPLRWTAAPEVRQPGTQLPPLPRLRLRGPPFPPSPSPTRLASAGRHRPRECPPHFQSPRSL